MQSSDNLKGAFSEGSAAAHKPALDRRRDSRPTGWFERRTHPHKKQRN